MHIIHKNSSPRHKRTESQRAADDAWLEHWSCRGKTVRWLTDNLAKERDYTLSTTQIQNDLVKVRQLWRQSAIVERTAAVAKELAGLQAQEDELWKAWERSKQDAVTKTTEKNDIKVGQTKVKGAKASKSTTRTEGQCGEAAYMKLILDIRDQRRKLLGIDAPTTIRPDGKGGATVDNPQGNGPQVILTISAGRAEGIMPTVAVPEPAQTPPADKKP